MHYSQKKFKIASPQNGSRMAMLCWDIQNTWKKEKLLIIKYDRTVINVGTIHWLDFLRLSFLDSLGLFNLMTEFEIAFSW